jgi:hypothetical protein
MRFSLAGIAVDVVVKDGLKTVSKVSPGLGYGHVAQTTAYHHMLPTTLTVTSSLADTVQLQFKSGVSWSCVMHFLPKGSGVQKQELLQCAASKARKQDKITVSVHDSTAKTQPSSQADVITII